MLAIVADEVGESEPIVAGDEIQARIGAASIVAVEVAAARETRGQFPDIAAIALPEAANAIAVFAIPLAP